MLGGVLRGVGWPPPLEIFVFFGTFDFLLGCLGEASLILGRRLPVMDRVSDLEQNILEVWRYV